MAQVASPLRDSTCSACGAACASTADRSRRSKTSKSADEQAVLEQNRRSVSPSSVATQRLGIDRPPRSAVVGDDTADASLDLAAAARPGAAPGRPVASTASRTADARAPPTLPVRSVMRAILPPRTCGCPPPPHRGDGEEHPATGFTARSRRGIVLTSSTTEGAARMSTRTIVLVHGGFVDGSGWQGVYRILRRRRLQRQRRAEPDARRSRTTSPRPAACSTGRTARSILVGHSYGGAVITEAGNHPKVAGLVYIAAFAPDKGESVNTLIADPPPGAPVPPILPPQDGFLFLDRDEVRGLVRRRRRPPTGRVHGRLAGPVGRRRARAARSASRRGATSRAGTSSPPTTG